MKPMRLLDLYEVFAVRLSFGRRHLLPGLKLDYDLRHGAKPAQMLLHALGPHVHRVDILLPTVAAVCVLGLVGLLHLFQAGPSFLVGISLAWSIIAILLPLHCFRLYRIVSGIDASTPEQVLVRLAPRAPRAAEIGGVLARELLMISVCEWLAILIVVVLGSAFLMKGIEWHTARLIMLLNASVVIASFAINGWTLRDYSGTERALFGGWLLQGTIAMGGLFAMVSFIGRPLIWTALAVCMMLIGALAIAGRWRTMAKAPAPFPTARLGR